VLRLPAVDVGDGWLIFGLPPSEVAFHPGDANDRHELYLLCDDVDAFVGEMQAAGVGCGPVNDRGWGRVTEVTLPGGGKLGVYEPRHARPAPARAAKPSPRPRASRSAKKRAAKPKVKAKAKARAPKGRRR
jgi:hypothetical protein